MPNKRDITWRSAIELAEMIKRREVSVTELTSIFLEKIEKVNPKINAFCTIMKDEAMEQAKEADDMVRNGEPLGPLHGVPVAIKDLTPVKGVRYTLGSKLFENQIADRDAVVVKRIRQAGGIIIGKTNTPEFGHKGTTDNLVFGATRNPWDTSKTPGGSSGGSAAAVAAGLVPIAEGTDGGGSIRIPSALCGVFGFKPTYGRVPMDVFGTFSSNAPYLHFGPITRDVADAALLYDIIKGHNSADPYSIDGGENTFENLEVDVSDLKIAYSPNLGFFEIDKEVEAVCENAAKTFESLGCKVDLINPNFSDPKETVEKVWFDLWCGLIASFYSDLPEDQLSLLEPKVQEFIKLGTELTAMDYMKANIAREETWLKLKEILDEYDAIITPTTAIPAFSLDIWGPEEINGKKINPMHGWFLTYPINLTGHPTASVPVGFSSEGLPIGMQIVGNRLDDLKVLQLSRAFERIQNWKESYQKIDQSIKVL